MWVIKSKYFAILKSLQRSQEQSEAQKYHGLLLKRVFPPTLLEDIKLSTDRGAVRATNTEH